MGARINFVLKAYETEKAHVTLYSHWGETEWQSDLAVALDKARPRWDDGSYGVRIVVSQLINDDWDKPHGFGLFTSTDGEEFWDAVVIVDFVNQTVTFDGNEQSFESFVEYQGDLMENHDFSAVTA